MARLRRHLALAAVILGATVLAVALAAAVEALRVLTEILPKNQVHDTYFVVPGAWIGLLLFVGGAIVDIAFRRTAARLGRPAPAVWKSHLLFTTGLLIVALAAGAGVLVKSDWQVALVLNASFLLLLIAHGTALAIGGTLLLRARTS